MTCKQPISFSLTHDGRNAITVHIWERVHTSLPFAIDFLSDNDHQTTGQYGVISSFRGGDERNIRRRLSLFRHFVFDSKDKKTNLSTPPPPPTDGRKDDYYRYFVLLPSSRKENKTRININSLWRNEIMKRNNSATIASLRTPQRIKVCSVDASTCQIVWSQIAKYFIFIL